MQTHEEYRDETFEILMKNSDKTKPYRPIDYRNRIEKLLKLEQKQVSVAPVVILPSDKKAIRDIREMFDKYYDYVYTTDDGEQRGEWKETFAISIINYFNQRIKARSK